MTRKILMVSAVAGMFLAFAFFATAKTGGGDITYSPKGAGKVVFLHGYHVDMQGIACKDCHFKTFQMAGNDSYKMDMAVLTKGKFCGSCHNGAKAFDLKEEKNCKRCHSK